MFTHKKMYSSQPELNNNWIKVSYKRGSEIEKLGHTVTNIWNIKQYRTKLPTTLHVFLELKPTLNNKDIFIVEYIQQCKIKFEPPKHKRDIAQCANCQRYGHKKLLPSQTEMRQMCR
jgi:hypothetical protein